jgi:hypothetical protein
VTAIDLRAYETFAPTIKRLRRRGYGHAYYLAFLPPVPLAAGEMIKYCARIC